MVVSESKGKDGGRGQEEEKDVFGACRMVRATMGNSPSNCLRLSRRWTTGNEKNSFAFGPGLRDDSLSRPGTESFIVTVL